MSRTKTNDARIAALAYQIHRDKERLDVLEKTARRLAVDLRKIADILDPTESGFEVESVAQEGRLITLKNQRYSIEAPSKNERELIHEIFETKTRLCKNQREFTEFMTKYDHP